MTARCVGCDAEVQVTGGPIHRYMTSAPGCWARYGELLGVLSIEPTHQAARQMCVDAYAARAWAESVWAAWSAHHPQVAEWYAKYAT